ncbi:MAG: type II toxin-antitoxin system RelE/ParE family toxin [Cyanobacteria bacterium P01_D01_bin.6]
MKVRFRNSFKKDLKRIKDKSLLPQIRSAIENVNAANSLGDVKNLIKLKGYQGFYRIRVGNYRLGLSIAEEEVVFVRCLHRKEIYQVFP